MKYIRQLLFSCKSREDLESLYFKLQELSQIKYVRKLDIMKCINKEKYNYIEGKYDCSVFLHFSDLNDIEQYCMHPLHINFVETVLPKVDITVLDYSINE